MYRILADLVVGLHFVFVLFVLAGGLLVLRWPKAAYLHIPAALWGVVIEFAGWVCPLTPLEKSLRRMAGEAGYPTGFIEHYLVPVLYPSALTRNIQILLGVLVIALNVAIYMYVMQRRSAQPHPSKPESTKPRKYQSTI
jgi:hypothetical protein